MIDHAAPHAAARDNLFGICAALGEDFGVNPVWLRLALAIALLFDLEKVLTTYAALGVVVLVSRLIVPNPKPSSINAAPSTSATGSIDTEFRKAA